MSFFYLIEVALSIYGKVTLAIEIKVEEARDGEQKNEGQKGERSGHGRERERDRERRTEQKKKKKKRTK